MNDSNNDYRKRSYGRDNADERRVSMRRDDDGHDSYVPRDRSRSPRSGDTRRRSRPRSPGRHRHRHHHRSHHSSTASHQDRSRALPFHARQLSRSSDLDTFRPLLAYYLDVQKRIDITTLDERELRGRWKSFVSKWNNGELAEGWYRPETIEDVMLDQPAGGNTEDRVATQERRHTSVIGQNSDDSDVRKKENNRPHSRNSDDEHEDDDDDDNYGPTLPGQVSSDHIMKSQSQPKHGPGIPTTSDLTLQRELEASDLQDARAMLREERKADRALQKERLEEIAPREEPGSRARTLEKRREARDANASFAKAKSSNDMAEVPDADLMGGEGEGGGLEEYKRMKREAERKKTEREVRREEFARARREERDERVREYREREAHTVDMLREIAKSRFG